MNKFLIQFFITLVFSSNIWGLFAVEGWDARQNGLANSLISENSDSIFNTLGLSGNPALMSLVTFPTMRMNYSQLYSLVGLDFSSADFIFPFKKAGIGIHVSTFGYDLYRETKIKLGIGYRIIPSLEIGLRIKVLNLFIAGLENSSTLGIDLGVNASLSKQLSFGAKVINCNHPQLSSHLDNSIPSIIGVGFNYKILKQWGSYVSLEKFSYDILRLSVGTEGQLFSSLYLRCGFRTKPNLLSMGLGLKIKNWQIDWSLQYPLNRLGSTQTWSLSHRFNYHKETQIKIKRQRLINLNQANCLTLETISGISPKTAAAIVLFRNTEHQFFHISQLTKIRGINQDIYAQIKNKISVHSTGKIYFPLKNERPQGLHINDTEMRDLVIAGLSPNKARKLIVWRNSKGGFLDIEEICKIFFLSKEDIIKIKKAIYGE